MSSALTGRLVTHRISELTVDGDKVTIRMKGDANEHMDTEEYVVGAGEQVWQPALTVSRGGYVVTVLARPQVFVPLLITVAALIALAVLPPSGRRNPDPEGALTP